MVYMVYVFFYHYQNILTAKQTPVFSIACLQAHLEAFQKRIEKVLSR